MLMSNLTGCLTKHVDKPNNAAAGQRGCERIVIHDGTSLTGVSMKLLQYARLLETSP